MCASKRSDEQAEMKKKLDGELTIARVHLPTIVAVLSFLRDQKTTNLSYMNARVLRAAVYPEAAFDTQSYGLEYN